MLFKSETEFNSAVRGALKARGLQCIHVREADVPGPLDLVVWKGRVLLCWIELKVDDDTLRPSQIEFIRNNPDCCIVMRWLKAADRMLVWFTNTKLSDPPFQMEWAEFIAWTGQLADWADKKTI